jgi:hypothetical protein
MTLLLEKPGFAYGTAITACARRRQRKDAQSHRDRDFEKIYLYPNSPACLLGAQVLGEDGVALAMAIHFGETIYDLEEAELCSGEHPD